MIQFQFEKVTIIYMKYKFELMYYWSTPLKYYKTYKYVLE